VRIEDSEHQSAAERGRSIGRGKTKCAQCCTKADPSQERDEYEALEDGAADVVRLDCYERRDGRRKSVRFEVS